MITIQIDEKDLIAYVKELMAEDDDLIIEAEEIQEIAESYIARLKEEPKETLAQAIIDEIYLESDELDDDEKE